MPLKGSQFWGARTLQNNEFGLLCSIAATTAATSFDGKTEINWMRLLNDFARNQLSHGEQNHGSEPASVTF